MKREELIISKEALVKSMNQHNFYFLDVRDKEKYEGGTFHNGETTAENYPYLQMKENLQKLKEDLKERVNNREIITVCTTGNKAQKAAALLNEIGYRSRALEGGLTEWNKK